MKDRIKDYFAFNKKEQRGLIVLLALMLLVAAVDILMPFLVKDEEFDITPFQMEVKQFLDSFEIADSVTEIKSSNYQQFAREETGPVLEPFLSSPFYFNPNELSEEDWKAMGMDERIAGNIIRYREKGGKFRNKEGFRKIYGMNDEVYAILEPYIRIEVQETKIQNRYPDADHSTFNSIKENTYQSYLPDSVMIELNTADSASLLGLRGIGPSYAGRIIKYRDRLGGFNKKEQLLEINGMDSIRLNQFKDQFIVDPLLIRQIDLNSVTFKELLKHPYFEYYLVKAIFNKKDEIRRFDSVEQIKVISVMYEELYDKISPYLTVVPGSK